MAADVAFDDERVGNIPVDKTTVVNGEHIPEEAIEELSGNKGGEIGVE